MSLLPATPLDALKRADQSYLETGETVTVPRVLLEDIRAALLLAHHTAISAGNRDRARGFESDRQRLLVFVPLPDRP